MASTKAYNEDKVALIIGCFIFLLALGKFAGLDLLGWGLKMGMWVKSPLDCWSSASKGALPGVGALIASYVFIAAVMSVGIKLMKGNIGKFLYGFTCIFFIAIACYTVGANAYIAANPTEIAKQGITWSLGLSTEAGLIVALVMGILLGNLTPGFAESLREACRP